MLRGYNTAFMFRPATDKSYIDNFADEMYFRNEKIDILRFPGGTIANTYRFNFKGYGSPNKAGENYIYDFIRFATQLTPRPTVSLVFNLYEELLTGIDLTGSNMAMLQACTDAGITVSLIEMSNELPQKKEITGLGIGGVLRKADEVKFRTKVNAYIVRANYYHDLIKAVDPDIITGIVTDVLDCNRGKVWNDLVMKSKCDTGIIHWYPEVSTVEALTAELKPRMDFIHKAGKKSVLTEGNWHFGPTGSLNLGKLNSPEHNALKKNYPDTFESLGGSMFIWYNLATSGDSPYSKYKI